MSSLFELSGADFSGDRKHRYALWRVWDEDLPKVMFIGLNPSTANESKDDPTIRRVISFAKSWGYGSVYMLNLHTFVTAYPDEIKTSPFTMQMGDKDLLSYAKLCEKVIFAWGNFKQAQDRAIQVINLFPDGYALAVNKNGSPKHPLYVKGDVIPKHYTNSLIEHTKNDMGEELKIVL